MVSICKKSMFSFSPHHKYTRTHPPTITHRRFYGVERAVFSQIAFAFAQDSFIRLPRFVAKKTLEQRLLAPHFIYFQIKTLQVLILSLHIFSCSTLFIDITHHLFMENSCYLLPIANQIKEYYLIVFICF